VLPALGEQIKKLASSQLLLPAPQLDPVAEQRLKSAHDELIAAGLDRASVDKLFDWIRTGDDLDLHRIQIRERAVAWQVPENELLRVALHATRSGILTLSWDTVCPHCRGVRDENGKLAQLKAEGHCDVCQIHFGTDTPEAVEVTFRVHSSVREVGRLSGWTVGYVISNQVALLVVLVLANRSSGGVASYASALVFFQLPHALVAVSLMSALVPEMSSDARRNNMRAYKQHFSSGIRLISLVVMPAATGYLVLARPIVNGLVQNGAATDVGLVARCLAMLAIGLLGFSLYLFTLRGFYALRDTKTPFRLALVRVALTLVLGYVFALPLRAALGLAPEWGAAGLTISAGLAGWIEFALLRRAVNQRIGNTGIRRSRLLTLWSSAVAAAGVAWAVRLVAPSNRPLLIGAVIIAAYGATYFVATFIAGVEDAVSIARRLRLSRGGA